MISGFIVLLGALIVNLMWLSMGEESYIDYVLFRDRSIEGITASLLVSMFNLGLILGAIISFI